MVRPALRVLVKRVLLVPPERLVQQDQREQPVLPVIQVLPVRKVSKVYRVYKVFKVSRVSLESRVQLAQLVLARLALQDQLVKLETLDQPVPMEWLDQLALQEQMVFKVCEATPDLPVLLAQLANKVSRVFREHKA